jgi:multiple sugar transport system permease protein
MSAVSVTEPRTRRWARAGWFRPYFFIAIPLAYLVVFQLYSIFNGIVLSLTDTRLLNPSAGRYIGLENYIDVLSSADFWSAVRVTLVYTLGCLVGAIGLGLGAALVLDRPFRGNAIVRSIVIIPWAAPSIAAVMVFVWIFNNQFGVANFFLQGLGLIDAKLAWRTDPDLALPTVIIVAVWHLFPLCALVLLAAMQSVQGDLYDAARVDGADSLNVIKQITLPSIMPTLVTLSLFVTIWSLRRFDSIWVMTQGGPIGRTNTLVIDVYRETFVFFEVGRGATIGVLGLVIATVITLFYFISSHIGERRGRRA